MTTARWGATTLVTLAVGGALLIGTSAAPLPRSGAAGGSGVATNSHRPVVLAGGPHVEGVRWGAKKWGDALADAVAKNTLGVNDPALDPGSLATVTTAIGARSVWAMKDSTGKAVTGQGVTVALLDTGIDSAVAGLNGPGKVLAGPDLSLEANSADLSGGDNFGHGTHLAGIIAARDPVTVDPKTGQPKPATASVQLGVAPDARLLAVKLGTRDGSTDVSEVIAGLDWVVQHRNDNGMRIRVINLSYGTESAQPYQVDPLAAAAENAWMHGIAVVVSGGNDGAGATGLTDPAMDPFVITVGASGPQGSVGGWKNPVVAAFSSHGTATRHVDLLAPGTSIVSLRDPGSFVDVNNPQGLVSGDSTGRLFRGSGTSQAAAVVSGSLALLLQAYPDLTPDQAKALLVNSAKPVPGSSVLDSGAGEVDINAAFTLAKIASTMSPAVLAAQSTQSFTPSTGLGSLEAARGGDDLTDPVTGLTLSGEVDVQGQAWVPALWRASSVNATAWAGGEWNGSRWSGTGWNGTAWADAPWDGTSWTGARWSDLAWDGARWSGARWSGARWTDQGWQ